MAEVQIQKLSIKHEAIMDYLLANPASQLGMTAGHFGVSQAWLSVIIHSDAFQSKLRERSDELFGATIVPLREKVLGIAHVGVEKLGIALEKASPVSDKQFIADTTDSILKNLGYSPKSVPSDHGTVNVQNNIYTVDSEALASARGKMQNLTPAIQGVLGEEDGKELSSTSKGVSCGGEGGGGNTLPGPPALCETTEEEGEKGRGAEV